MKKYSLVILLAFIFFGYSLRLFAADEAEIILSLGKGQVKIQIYGLEISADLKEALERELEQDRQLSDRVISSAVTEVKLQGDVLESIKDKLKSGEPEQSIEEITNLVHLQLNGGSPVVPGAGEDAGQENRRVVVGGKFELAQGESLEELVILGGQAEIRGKVARLTVKGGQVRIHSSAEITEELDNLGGDLQIHPGAKVHHGPSQVFSPFHRSFDLFLNSANEFNLFDLVGSSVFLWGFRFFKIFFLLCVGLLVVRLAPDLFLEVQRNIREDFFGAGLAGFLYLVAYLPVALFLVVTVFGISLLPVQFLLTGYLSVMGCVAAMQVIVNKLGFFRERHELIIVSLGILIFEIFGWIPYIGALAHVGITVLGIGASFLVLWDRVRRRKVV
ncbi:MAG: hypothetical protein IPL83_04355 [Bdellovibrionales bacterium]|nr:hypothetical protein [Bdellovibrionales bacterium]